MTNLSLDLLTAIGVNLVAIGGFYGAIKVEISWIKKTLERLEDNQK
jgi:hypothetical protein